MLATYVFKMDKLEVLFISKTENSLPKGTEEWRKMRETCGLSEIDRKWERGN